MLLEIKDLWVRYDLVEALRGISLNLAQSEIVTILGANGAGKSTTLKTVSGLKEPGSGEIWFREERIDGLPPHEVVRRGIAQVPEGRRIFPEMTVMDNLLMGTHLRKDSTAVKQDLEYVFTHFPILQERKNQQGGSLSGGEQQMLVIGRSLMSNPQLLILDEPSLGLAPIIVEKVLDTVTMINENGVTILLVEQNIRDSLNISDRAYVLEDGKILLQGEARELLNNNHIKQVYLGL